MKLLNFDSENLALDWISFNLEGLINPRVIADRFSKHFTPHVLVDDVPCIGYHGLNKKSSYIENLSDEERRLRMEQIRSPEE